jgi:hypothetical protein
MNRTAVCKSCSLVHKINREKKGPIAVGRCPLCGEPHGLFKVATPGDEAKAIKLFMLSELDEHREIFTGEPIPTKMAESAADAFQRFDWLEDDLHQVWEIAVDLANSADEELDDDELVPIDYSHLMPYG